MNDKYRDCLACKQSMSEESEDGENDKLWCTEKQCYVNELDSCEEFSK